MAFIIEDLNPIKVADLNTYITLETVEVTKTDWGNYSYTYKPLIPCVEKYPFI